MQISKQLDYQLKLGNLILAIALSTVPTAITIFIFTIYGFNLCNQLVERKYITMDYPVKEVCLQNSLDLSKEYLLLIWLFISLPTWRWFYISHLARIKRINLKSN